MLTITLVKINGDVFSSCRQEFFGIVKEALQQHFKISIDKLLKHLSQTGSDLTDDDIRSLTCTHVHTCTHTYLTYSSPSLLTLTVEICPYTCMYLTYSSCSILLSLPFHPHIPISLPSLSTHPHPLPSHPLTVEVCSLETTWCQEQSHVSMMKFWTLDNSPPLWRSRPPIAAVAPSS